MIFGQLTERNMRTIFFGKLHTKCDGDTIPRPFSKKSKLSISLDQYSKVWYNFFLWYAKLSTIRTFRLSCRPLAFTSHRAFLNNKKSGTSIPVSFSAWFLMRNISRVIFYYLAKFHCLVALISWDIGQYVYFNCLLTRLWRYKFRNEPYPSN